MKRFIGISLMVVAALAVHAQTKINPNRISWPIGVTGCVFAPGTLACVPNGSGGGGTIPVLVQSKQNSCGVGPCGTVLTAPVNPASALIFECMHGSSGDCSVVPTDVQGDTFTLTNTQDLIGEFEIDLFVACNAVGGPTTITSASGGTIQAAYEISNVALTDCIDGYNSGQNTSNNATQPTGPLTTTQPNDFIFVSGATRTGLGGSTMTEANGYTALVSSGLIASALTYNSWYGVQATGASVSDTVSYSPTAGGEYAGILALKPGSSSAAWPPVAPGPTFSPAGGSYGSGVVVTDTCPGSATPWISTGVTPVAGATGITVSVSKTLYGSCQGSGYFTTGLASYTVTPGFSIVNTGAYGSGNSSVTSQALSAFAGSLTNPSLIFVHEFAVGTPSSFPVPTDTAGNTYLDCGGGIVTWNSSRSAECFYALNTHTTASNVVTVRSSSGVNNLNGNAFEITGGATSSPIDGGPGAGYSVLANGTGGSAGADNLSATALTPNGSGDLIIAMFKGMFAVPTVGTSPNLFTSISSATAALPEYFLQPVSASITATASDSYSGDPYSALVVAIRP